MIGENAAMEYPVFSRNVQVDYYEKEKNLWHIVSHLKDHEHDIVVTLEVSTPDMMVQDADVRFVRYPMPGCTKFVEKIKILIGTCLYTDFREKMIFFLGAEGCPNAMNLVSVAGIALIFFYFPNLVAKGEMKAEEWWEMVHGKMSGNCIAH